MSLVDRLRVAGFDVTEHQLYYLQGMGWQYPEDDQQPQRITGPGARTLSNEDYLLLCDIVDAQPDLNRFQLAAVFNEITGLRVSASTIDNTVQLTLQRRTKKKIPILNARHLEDRKIFHQRISENPWLWEDIAFSDESLFHYYPRPINNKVWSRNAHDPARGVPAVRHPPKYMVHGVVSWTYGALPLHIYQEGLMINETAYFERLQAVKRELHPEAIYQQDNATVHTSANIHALLNSMRRLTWWAANSPDYSPIESVWRAMKKVVYSRSYATREDFWEALRREWENQTTPEMWSKHLSNAMDAMERSAAIGYRTVH